MFGRQIVILSLWPLLSVVKSGNSLLNTWGVPFCLGLPKKGLWDLVVERIDKKLSSWKGRYLSMGGRITLVSSFEYPHLLSILFQKSYKCLMEDREISA